MHVKSIMHVHIMSLFEKLYLLPFVPLFVALRVATVDHPLPSCQFSLLSSQFDWAWD